MASQPPPSPASTLARVIRIASINGKGVLIVAGLFALLSALLRDAGGAVIGCLIAGAGALEAHGATLLRNRQLRGLDWLIRSELGLLALMLIYSAINLLFFKSAMLEAKLTPDMVSAIKQAGWTKEQFLQFATVLNTILFSVVGFVSLIYQGGLAFYYKRKRAAVTQAIEQEDPENLPES